MSESYLGSELSGQAADDAAVPQPLAAAPPRRRATDRIAEDSGALTRFEQEQLARELADIERASAVLRLGEPALQSWTKPSVPVTAKKPRPLWLLIGLLWLSTALITVGAVAAIATFAG
jgi:hypothetical protein